MKTDWDYVVESVRLAIRHTGVQVGYYNVENIALATILALEKKGYLSSSQLLSTKE